MLYYLFKYLQENFGLSGSGLFQYITFRASMAIIVSLIISMLIGRRVIRWLQKMQIGESVRDLGLHGQVEKKMAKLQSDWMLTKQQSTKSRQWKS